MGAPPPSPETDGCPMSSQLTLAFPALSGKQPFAADLLRQRLFQIAQGDEDANGADTLCIALDTEACACPEATRARWSGEGRRRGRIELPAGDVTAPAGRRQTERRGAVLAQAITAPPPPLGVDQARSGTWCHPPETRRPRRASCLRDGAPSPSVGSRRAVGSPRCFQRSGTR